MYPYRGVNRGLYPLRQKYPGSTRRNMRQRTKSDTTPLARNNGPATAQAAGRAMEKSKNLRHQCDWVAAIVRCRPGLTASEYAELCPENMKALIYHRIARRAKTCREKHLIRAGPIRKCTITGRMCMTHLPPLAINPITGELTSQVLE